MPPHWAASVGLVPGWDAQARYSSPHNEDAGAVVAFFNDGAVFVQSCHPVGVIPQRPVFWEREPDRSFAPIERVADYPAHPALQVDVRRSLVALHTARVTRLERDIWMPQEGRAHQVGRLDGAEFVARGRSRLDPERRDKQCDKQHAYQGHPIHRAATVPEADLAKNPCALRESGVLCPRQKRGRRAVNTRPLASRPSHQGPGRGGKVTRRGSLEKRPPVALTRRPRA